MCPLSNKQKNTDEDFNFEFDNFGGNKKSQPGEFGKEIQKSGFEDPNGDPFAEPGKDNEAETSQNKINYALETIEEDPREIDSRKASKVSFRGKPEANSEYNLKSTKNAPSQDRNFEIHDFESYHETVDGRSMVDSTNYNKENPTNEMFMEKR